MWSKAFAPTVSERERGESTRAGQEPELLDNPSSHACGGELMLAPCSMVARFFSNCGWFIWL